MTGAEFRPQPWRHLQNVLRKMGHLEDAREIGVRFEKQLYKADLVGIPPKHWGHIRKRSYRTIMRGLHMAFFALAGYGYRPVRLLIWFLSIWVLGGIFYWNMAIHFAVFAPSNPHVFQNPAYSACIPHEDNRPTETTSPTGAREALAIRESVVVEGAGNWYLCKAMRDEYTGFSPLAYSLDVILPLVDLQQQSDWAPMIPTANASWWKELFIPTWRHTTRLIVWSQTLFGWIASLLLVAVLSGLTKHRED